MGRYSAQGILGQRYAVWLWLVYTEYSGADYPRVLSDTLHLVSQVSLHKVNIHSLKHGNTVVSLWPLTQPGQLLRKKSQRLIYLVIWWGYLF